MNEDSRVMAILNAAAGTAKVAGGETIAERLADLFRAAGIDARIELADGGASLDALAAEARRDRYGIVIAGGGDGTINSVAAHLVGTDARLGVLPLGTLNHFAKDLGIPLDLDGAAETILANHTAQVDVGEVNDRIFINNSGLGLYPIIVRSRERQQERLGRGKWYALLRAGITVLRRYPVLSLRLTADGETLPRRTPIVFVGNNEYESAGFQLGGRSRLDEGVLSVYVANRVGRARLMRLSIAALFGSSLGDAPDFDSMRVAELRIETRRKRLLVSIDGEVEVMDAPLLYRIRRGSLRVIVPRGEDAGEQV